MQHERILFFSAYAPWHYHTQIELTLAAALRLRKAQVRMLTCDGLFPVCDVHRRNLNPRQVNSCNACQASTARLMADGQADYRWLSRYVTPTQIAQAEAWVQSLEAAQLASATWNDRPLADWALSSALYQERRTQADWKDPAFAQLFRDQLQGTRLAFEAANAAFDDFQPDLLVLLNGRFFAHRAAIEAARERHVRFVTHERGMQKNSLCWRDGELTHDLEGEMRSWSQVAQQPLENSQIDFVQNILRERRHGKGMSWDVRYSPLPEEREALIAKLALDARPIVALFTSSEDEQATFPRWAEGAFANGCDWLDATLEVARAIPTHQFVIRMHPGLLSMGTQQAALKHAQDLAKRLPENCRLVGPKDDISSYTLADIAELGIVYYTTLGLEMAARGKRVICVVRGWYGHAGFADFVQDKQDYAATIKAALGREPELEIARRALRYAWNAFGVWSLQFQKIVEEPRHLGKRTYTTLSELSPGADKELDRICEFLQHGRPLFVAPSKKALLEQLDAETRRIAHSLELAPQAAPLAQLAANCDSVLAQIEAAETAFGAGNGDHACELLLAVLEQAPDAIRAWKDLGSILHAGGHRDDAAAALERVLCIDPQDQEARFDLELIRGGA